MAALLRPRVSAATFRRVNRLTKQEQLVLCTVLGLLLLGLATKTFRAPRPLPELPQAAQK
jgi:hypothetical protein